MHNSGVHPLEEKDEKEERELWKKEEEY